jgi:hypothetical protein
MIVAHDSPLRAVPGSAEPPVALFLNGICYSVELADLATGRLRETLCEIARFSYSHPGFWRLNVAAFADAWAVVDSVNRLRTLVSRLPGLRQNDPQIQLLLRSIRPAEPLRNFVQHIDTEIARDPRRRQQLWGSIRWSFTNPATGMPEGHTIVAGSMLGGMEGPGCVYDSWEKRFLQVLELQAGEHQLDIDAVQRRLTTFTPWLEQWVRTKFPGPGVHTVEYHAALVPQRVAAPIADRLGDGGSA